MSRRRDPNAWTAKDAVRWRERMGWTQQQAADAMQTTVGTIFNREHGLRALHPSDVLLMRYIERFGRLTEITDSV